MRYQYLRHASSIVQKASLSPLSLLHGIDAVIQILSGCTTLLRHRRASPQGIVTVTHLRITVLTDLRELIPRIPRIGVYFTTTEIFLAIPSCLSRSHNPSKLAKELSNLNFLPSLMISSA